MRCFESYRWFLERIGSAHKVFLQSRLDVPVLRVEDTGDVIKGTIRRTGSPAPLHLMRSLLRYPHMSMRERTTAARTALALRQLASDLRAPDLEIGSALDDMTFGQWLRSRGESENAIESFWNLIVLPTANLHNPNTPNTCLLYTSPSPRD